jgi:type I restriction enzyme R subunit
VLDLVVRHPTIAAIERGDPVSDDQLLSLERTLRRELGGDSLDLSESNIRKAYALRVDSLLGFLRHLLGLDGLPDYREIVERQFDDYLARHTFNGDQVLFLRTVRTVLARQRHLTLSDMYFAPFTSFGQDAVHRLFAPAEIEQIMQFTERLSVA